MTEQKPSIGRDVHYVSHGTKMRIDGTQAFTSECRAAKITEVGEPNGFAVLVGLCVFNPTGMFFDRGVEWDQRPESDRSGGTWHWPERV